MLEKLLLAAFFWAPILFKPYKTSGLGTDFGQCFRFSDNFNQDSPVGITLEKASITITYSYWRNFLILLKN